MACHMEDNTKAERGGGARDGLMEGSRAVWASVPAVLRAGSLGLVQLGTSAVDLDRVNSYVLILAV